MYCLFVYCLCCELQIVDGLSLTSIKDRAWQIQPCSATTKEGLDVSVPVLSGTVLFWSEILIGKHVRELFRREPSK